MEALPLSLKRDLDELQQTWELPETECSASEVWDAIRLYVSLLYRWSGRMNLVSRGDREALAAKHVWRALAMLPFVRGHDVVLDIGSGAGLPAVPLKICLPNTRFYLVESRRRRVHFLKEVKRRLGLKKIEVVHCRVEDWDAGGIEAGVVTARAVGNPSALIRWGRKYAGNSTLLICTLAGSGPRPEGALFDRRLEWRGESVRIGGFPLGPCCYPHLYVDKWKGAVGSRDQKQL